MESVSHLVKEVTHEGRTLYICEICDLKYAQREWAKKCEEYCSEHNACSLEITKHAEKNT